MRTALRTLEGLLLDGGGRTARRNAWQAVLADRDRARSRAEAERLLTAMPAAVAPSFPAVPGAPAVPSVPSRPVNSPSGAPRDGRQAGKQGLQPAT